MKIKFICNKLGRDKSAQKMISSGITPFYKILEHQKLCIALKEKLIEEADEVKQSITREEIISELADIFEVIDGLCKAYKIAHDEIISIKKAIKEEIRYNFFD